MRPYVLLIEDNLADAELARAAIANAELDVEFVHAFNAEEGTILLRAALQRPDSPRAALVLLDLGLPGVDGLSVLKGLREAEETSALPVVAFSGNTDPKTVRTALRSGANAYVHKADDVDVYFRRISHVVETFLVHSVSPLSGA